MESAEIDVRRLLFEPENIEHIRRHGIEVDEVEEVLHLAPQYFMNPEAPGRTATHLILGPNRTGRFLLIAISSTGDEGVWWPHTAHRVHSRIALRFYRRGDPL